MILIQIGQKVERKNCYSQVINCPFKIIKNSFSQETLEESPSSRPATRKKALDGISLIKYQETAEFESSSIPSSSTTSSSSSSSYYLESYDLSGFERQKTSLLSQLAACELIFKANLLEDYPEESDISQLTSILQQKALKKDCFANLMGILRKLNEINEEEWEEVERMMEEGVNREEEKEGGEGRKLERTREEEGERKREDVEKENGELMERLEIRDKEIKRVFCFVYN